MNIYPHGKRTIVFVFCLVLQTICYAYYDESNRSYTSNQYNNQPSFYSNYATSFYTKLDLFHTTTRSDFLSSSIFASQRMVMQQNGTFTDFCATKLAKDINLSDFSGCRIENEKQWSSFSSLTYGYDTVTFSKVKYQDNKVVNCMMNTDRGGNVCDALTHAQYNTQGLPTGFTITSYGPRGIAVMPQTVYGILCKPSNDQNRYTNELTFNKIKAADPETYGFPMNVATLESGCEPPHYIAQSFGIRAAGYDIQFKNVEWARDTVTGFTAHVKDPVGSFIVMHVTSVLDNDFKISSLGIDLTRNGVTEHTTWSRESNVSLQKVVDDMKLGVNPLKILGSSAIQLGEAKVAYLAHSFDEVVQLENQRGNIVERCVDAVKTWISKAVDWLKGVFGKEAHATVHVSDTTVCKVSVASGAGEDVARTAKKAETVLDKLKTWVSNVFSSGYSVKTSETSIKNTRDFLNGTVKDAGICAQESKKQIVGLIDSTKQSVFDGFEIAKNGAMSIGNNVSSIAKNAGAMNSQNMLMTALYTFVNVQQGIATYKATHGQLDGEQVRMIENVAMLTNMQEVNNELKDIEENFQSAVALKLPKYDLKFNGRNNYQPQSTQVNLVKIKSEVTTENLTFAANAGVNVVGFNGLMCNVSASVQYNNSVMSIQYENNFGQEMRHVHGGFNYSFGNNATVRFEANKQWLLFTFNLKY